MSEPAPSQSASTRVIVPLLDFSRSGGMRVLTEVANRFCELGFSTLFVVPAHSEAPYFPVDADIVYVDGLGRSRPRAGANVAGALRLAKGMTGLARAIRRLARAGDIVIANHWTTTYPSIACRRGVKKVYYIQAYEADRFDRHGSLAAKAQRLLALGSYQLQFEHVVNAPLFIGFPHLHATTWIPPGIDLGIFARKAAISTAVDRTVVMGCIGRAEAYKGTDDAIDAFRILRESGRAVELAIAFGSDDMVERAGPGARAVPAHGDSNLADFYRSLDVLVAAGTVELGACHYPVIEAMACGTPVVTTGYMPASNHNSWIVAPSSPSEIALAVTEAVSDPDETMRRVDAARESIARFEWRVVIDEFLDFLGLCRGGNVE